MGEFERLYRRQIKTTLSKDQETAFDAICKAQGIKESQLARDAIVEKLNNMFCDEVIAEVREKEIFQNIKNSLGELMKNYSNFVFAHKIPQV